MEAPVARVGRGSEDAGRQLLDTVASVAADPEGYKSRLADLDSAQAKALERETAARKAERDANDARIALQAERQAVEAAREQMNEQAERTRNDLIKARAKHDAIVETERNTLKRESEALAQRTAEVEKLKTDLSAQVALHDRAIAVLQAERGKSEALNADLAKAIDAANAREAAASRALARVKALASE